MTRSQTAIDVSIDVSAHRHPIDARIYGVAFADAASLVDLRVPLNRRGGNVTSRYNWQANVSNRASDWYFESIPEGPAVAGASADAFISAVKSQWSRAAHHGSAASMGRESWSQPEQSVQLFDCEVRSADRCRYAVVPGRRQRRLRRDGPEHYGQRPQRCQCSIECSLSAGLDSAPGEPLGNCGQRAGSATTRSTTSQASGIRLIVMSIQRGATMDEVFNAAVAYATQIKAVDPTALIMGPEEWGWTGYRYSGADQQWAATHGWNNLPDRTAHGNADYVPWYLDQMRRRDQAAGQRLLDIFSLHFYPQGGQYGNDTSTAMQLLRNRSTRALWDPAYVDESWIGAPVQLIPLMKNLVGSVLSGDKDRHHRVSLGSRGSHQRRHDTGGHSRHLRAREPRSGDHLDLSASDRPPLTRPSSCTATTTVRDPRSATPASLPSHRIPTPFQCSQLSEAPAGALTIMAINKDLSSSPSVNFRVSGFTSSGAAQVWRLTSSNAITRLADATVSGTTLAATLPAQSITLFVLSPGAAPQHWRPGERGFSSRQVLRIMETPKRASGSVRSRTGDYRASNERRDRKPGARAKSRSSSRRTRDRTLYRPSSRL